MVPVHGAAAENEERSRAEEIQDPVGDRQAILPGEQPGSERPFCRARPGQVPAPAQGAAGGLELPIRPRRALGTSAGKTRNLEFSEEESCCSELI